MAIRIVHRRRGYTGVSPAFSLIELIVALAVISIAATIFISLYVSSLNLARSSANRRLAASFAEARLNDLLRHPDRFHWEFPAETGNLNPFPIRSNEDEPKAGNVFDPPSILPAELAAVDRQVSLPGRFRWQAMGRLPSLNAAYYEVTVVVRWEESARPQLLALTSSVPKFAVPGVPEPLEAEADAEASPGEDAA